MASLQREPTGTFHVVFRVDGNRFKRSLETKIESVAISRREEIDETLALLKRKRLTIPEGVGVVDFVIEAGRVDQISVKNAESVKNDSVTRTTRPRVEILPIKPQLRSATHAIAGMY